MTAQDQRDTGADPITNGAGLARTIRGLAMDGVQAANSGHPGAPMGMADMATVLWSQFLRYDPADPAWPDRDRVVLSNGHASMLLYAMLHLSGTSLELDDLKQFRQWGARTAGHPEYGYAAGIETTTGPLGQGIANGVGMAIAERWLRTRFGAALSDHRTWVFAGDGCLMEGISNEAASLAGHLRLGRLIVLYDDNNITIDGSTDLSFSEDVPGRFRALGWRVLSVDGLDQRALAAAMADAVAQDAQPTLICCRTVIGYGSPKKAGSSSAHGAPLGVDEVRASKLQLGLDPDQSFYVDQAAVGWLRARDGERAAANAAWRERLASNPDAAGWTVQHQAPAVDAVAWPTFEAGKSLATRKASQAVIQAVAASIPQLLGGSADLAESNGSLVHGGGDVSGADFSGRNLHFGIREHAMASICNGLALHGGVQPYCATFLAFHDYMRPSVRLAALMHLPVIYVYTHDSVFLGEDGPTHQPVEHLAAMRSMPNLWVVRPADANETVEAWKLALTRRDGPTALCLTRQNLPIATRHADNAASLLHRGGYVLAEAEGGPTRLVLIATGSEVGLAMDARIALQGAGLPTRVVSLPCTAAFDRQSAEYRDQVLPPGTARLSIEAGVTYGWERYVGALGASIGIDRFGASAPGEVVAEKLGLNVGNVVATAHRLLGL